MSALPQTRYARSGDVTIAYQVVGEGPVDLLLVPGFLSHVEWSWELPASARFLRRLASFSRLIVFDKRGTGMSDPVDGDPVPGGADRTTSRAVLDAAGSERAALLGVFDGAALALVFAAERPSASRRSRSTRAWRSSRRGTATTSAGRPRRSSSTSRRQRRAGARARAPRSLRRASQTTPPTGAGSPGCFGSEPAPGARSRSCG